MNNDRQFLKTMPEIVAWLNNHDIQHFILLEDADWGYKVNIDGPVYLRSKGLDFIPVKFNVVEGYFHCGFNDITNLDFCPEKVLGDFDCSETLITSLKGGPKIVAGDYRCSDNDITSLEGVAEFVGDDFIANCCQLNTLEFCPKELGGVFNIHDNPDLKEAQTISDFKEIQKIQQEILVNIEKEFLDSKISKPLALREVETEVHKI